MRNVDEIFVATVSGLVDEELKDSTDYLGWESLGRGSRGETGTCLPVDKQGSHMPGERLRNISTLS